MRGVLKEMCRRGPQWFRIQDTACSRPAASFTSDIRGDGQHSLARRPDSAASGSVHASTQSLSDGVQCWTTASRGLSAAASSTHTLPVISTIELVDLYNEDKCSSGFSAAQGFSSHLWVHEFECWRSDCGDH